MSNHFKYRFMILLTALGIGWVAGCDRSASTGNNNNDNSNGNNNNSGLCGNGQVDPGETCDGDCPTSCDDQDPCTTDTLSGDSSTCDAECASDPITACAGGDGCCAPGCDETNDDDCSPVCGNGVVETGETCDGDCPADCVDADPCTTDTMTGDATTCDVVCANDPITTCTSTDGCCAPGCDETLDDDCSPVCGNDIVETGEVCDTTSPMVCTDLTYADDPGLGTCSSCDWAGCCADPYWHLQTVDSSADVGRWSALALDASDNPHISYYDGTNGDLKYAYYDGVSWTIETVDASGQVGNPTALALDSAGLPRIAYRDTTNGLLKFAAFDGATWTIETVDATYPNRLSLKLDSFDNPHIAYNDSGRQDLKYAYHDGAAWAVETVDATGNIGNRMWIAVDSSDRPHIAYRDVGNQDLKYAYHDGSAWVITTVDATGDTGDHPSIALDDADLPHISYRDVSNTVLRYAYHDGNGWQLQSVPAGANSGPYSTIVLDSAGRPHIAYRGVQTASLKYAWWTGSAWWVEEIENTSNSLGNRFNYIALDSTGRPRVSYHDDSANTLKYAQLRCVVCGDGVTDPGETCDDGNTLNDDGCDVACQLECGNGQVDGGEDCDDSGESATCDADCTFVACGDGTLNWTAGETCEDGNQTPGDGCDASCVMEGNCVPFGTDGAGRVGCAYDPALAVGGCDDITATGTDLQLDDDDHAAGIPLGFSFDFYGTTYTQVSVASNGTIYFDSGYLGLLNECIPGTNIDGLHRFIAVFWDDLDPSAGGTVRYEALGTAPDRRFVVQWNAPRYDAPGMGMIRAVLFEGSSLIRVCYEDTIFDDVLSDNGAGATAGIQSDPSLGLQFSCYTATLVNDLVLEYRQY